jgi:peroxiredoxin
MIKQNESIPPFTLPKVFGGTFSSTEFKGKQTLLYFMRGTW